MSKPSALARKTVLGAMWTIATGIGTRILGLLGTLILTRFIAPDVYGEVSAASVVILTAHFMTSLGLGQYIASHPDADRQTIFNATVYFLTVGFLAIGLVFVLRHPIAHYIVKADGMIQYMPGLAIAILLERFSYIPDRLMVRDMRFRSIGIRNMISELSYTISSVGLAMLGYGGNAIVAGTLLRAITRLIIILPSVDRRDWLSPSPLSRQKAREMLSFGIPLSLGSMANFGAQRWDNLLIIRLFGERIGGLYTLAWNLADIPASQVGERVGDVLVPSFAKLEPERRKAALIRSLTLLSLILFPLATGLGAVAPTILNDTFFNAAWQPAAPLLTVLSALGVTRPIGWVISSYLQVHGRTRLIMVLEWLKVIFILAGIFVLGRLGSEVWACAGVGLAFGIHALASLGIVRHLDKIPFSDLLVPLIRPLLACVPLIGAVLAVRYGLQHIAHVFTGFRLTVEVTVGAIAFALSALVIAKKSSHDLLRVARDAVKRRGKKQDESE